MTMLLLYLSTAFVTGIVAASLTRLPLFLWAWWLVLPAGLFFIARRDSFFRRAPFLLLAFLLGAIRYTVALPQFDSNSLAAYNDHGEIAMSGAVAEPPDVRDRSTNLRVSITRVRPNQNWQDAHGVALVQVPRETDVRYGDEIEVSGEPTTPFETEDFSYKDYLARQGILSLVRVHGSVSVLARDQGNPFFTALYAFRDRALATIHAIFPEPAASLLAGILLGVDSGIPRDVRDAFSATNTAHIIAISGFNVAIVAGILSKLARRVLSAQRATFFVIAGLTVYTLLVGAGASVVRAAIMGSLTVLALHYNRQNDAINALAIAALLMCAVNPFTIFDISFQLSFLATLGLVLYTTPLTNWFEKILSRVIASAEGAKQSPSVSEIASSQSFDSRLTSLGVPSGSLLAMTPSQQRAKQIVGLLSDSLIVTIAAQITTTPLILFAFHRLSLIGLVTNFLILPAQPPVMIWGGLATFAGMIFQPLGQILAWIAWAFLEWTIVIVQATASVPFASIEIGRLDVLLVAMWYVILFGTTRVNLAGIREHITLRPALALGGALVAGVLIWNVYATAPDGKTRVVFIDAGSAATFVRTAQGNKILIDGGANPSTVLSVLGQRMPFWDRGIDLVVLTSADDNHLAGLVEVIARYDIKQIVQVSAPAKPSAAYLKWQGLVAQKRVPSLQAQSGLQIALDRGVTLAFLHPPGDAKESGSAITRLRAEGIAFLFADGAAVEDQSALLKANNEIASAVLIAPRKIAPGFFDAANPQYAILFTGKGARDKPSADLLAALSRATVLQTDERGTIEMIVDGRSIAIKTVK